MKYISATTWRDLSDGHLYHEGDLFPFDGRVIEEERLRELGNANNRAGLVLVRAVDEPKAEPKEKEPENVALIMKCTLAASTFSPAIVRFSGIPKTRLAVTSLMPARTPTPAETSMLLSGNSAAFP